MAGVLQHLRSSTLNKRPNPSSMVDGQVAINYASGAPGMFFKDSNGALVKVGPVHVGSGAPNAVPASGGTAGNSLGEQWLDTSGGTYVFKIWDGSAWRSEAGEFVNVTGDTMTGALGIIAGSASSPSLFFSGDTNNGLYSPGADQVAISTNGTGRLFVASDGKIGCGIASPSYGLQLINSASSFALGETGSNVRLVLNYGSPTSSTAAPTITSDGVGLSYFGRNGYAGQHIFYSGTSNSERMRLDSSGRLGLGTSAPTGNLSFGASDALISSDTADGSDNKSITLAGGGAATTSRGAYLTLYGNEHTTGIGGASLVTGLATGSDLSLHARTSTSSILLYVNNAERARIDSSGRLLVGTSSDSGGALLQVNGNRVRIATAKTPASASDTGTTGEICWDANYIYVCTATNTWKRTAIATW